MNPYRTASPVSGVIISGRTVARPRFELPVGVSALITALAIMLGIAVLTSGCSAFLHEAEKAAADFFPCMVANQDLPDEDALLKCGGQTVSDELRSQGLAALHEARKQTTLHAVKAHDIGAHETKEALANAGCLKDGGK